MHQRFYQLLLLILSVIVSGCTSTQAPSANAAEQTSSPTTLHVFAAASLTDAFTEIGQNFAAAHPGIEVVFNFAASNQLATQIGAGAPADVFAAASNPQMDVAIETGRIVTGTQQTFVHNRLVVVIPSDNPAGLTSLLDIAKPGVKIVFAAKEVPVGQYSLDFLDKAATDSTLGTGYKAAVLANVVSYEENVRVVLTKVTLGEADAGIVYTSDVVASATGEVGQIEIPDNLNTTARYPIAPLRDSPNLALAQQFIEYVLAPAGQQILVNYGFISPTGD